MQPLENISPQLWEIQPGLFFFHQLFQNLNFKKFAIFWCWIDQFPRSPRTVSGYMLTWFNKLSFQPAATIKISIFLWLHCALYFLDDLHSNGNVLPSHLRLSCNWGKDLQNHPWSAAFPMREKIGSLKTLACEQQRVKEILMPPHFWGRICSKPRNIPGNKDRRAGLQFPCQGWIFGITGNCSLLWTYLMSFAILVDFVLCSLPFICVLQLSSCCLDLGWIWISLSPLSAALCVGLKY